MRWKDIICEDAQPLKLYHITDNPKFKLDPNFEPQDNSFSISDRSGIKGIYLARDVEPWVNGKGYIRPFVAEILTDPSALEHDTVGRWAGEIFIPASQFDKLKVLRVIPLDALCREVYGEHGWIEDAHGYKFDTGEEIKHRGWDEPYAPAFTNYRYEHDTRTMPAADVRTLKQRFKAGYKSRLKNR